MFRWILRLIGLPRVQATEIERRPVTRLFIWRTFRRGQPRHHKVREVSL